LPLNRQRNECNQNNVKAVQCEGYGNRKAFEAAPRGTRRRPPRELAGEVDARILDAAQRLFLERGSQVPVWMRLQVWHGPESEHLLPIPSKETLFTAVVMRGLLASIERFESDAPTGASVEDRLRA